MRSRSTRPSTVARSRPRCRKPSRPNRRSTWIVAFARTLRTGKSDSPARSPLSSTTPARSGPSGEWRSSSWPSQAALPSARSIPASARRNCSWPLPSAPAMPRISPLATSGRSARSARRAGPRRRARPRAPPRRRAAPGNASSSGRPIISATRLSSVIAGGVERPLADAVAKDGDAVGDAEHLRQAVADVDDADSRRGSARARARAGARRPPGPSAVVGSSSSSTFGRASSDLTTSSSWRSASDSDAHRRLRGHVEVELGELLRGPCLHPAVRRLLAARHREVQVLGDRQVADVRVGLVRDSEAELAGLGRGAPAARLARRSRRCLRPGGRSRSRSRAMSISRTRSPRRGHGSPPAGSRR